jgi:hypothetical protein
VPRRLDRCRTAPAQVTVPIQCRRHAVAGRHGTPCVHSLHRLPRLPNPSHCRSRSPRARQRPPFPARTWANSGAEWYPPPPELRIDCTESPSNRRPRPQQGRPQIREVRVLPLGRASRYPGAESTHLVIGKKKQINNNSRGQRIYICQNEEPHFLGG